MRLARTVQPVFRVMSSTNMYGRTLQHSVFWLQSVGTSDERLLHKYSCVQSVMLRRWASSSRRFEGSPCIHLQGWSTSNIINFLHRLTVKTKTLRCFETSRTNGPAKKNGLHGLLDLEAYFLPLFTHSYVLSFITSFFFSCVPRSLLPSIPSLDLPCVFLPFFLSFLFVLFLSVFPAVLFLPLFLINYFTLPRLVSGSGAASVLRNIPSRAAVISDVVKLTVEFLATLFLLQMTDSRSLAFKAGFLQFLHSDSCSGNSHQFASGSGCPWLATPPPSSSIPHQKKQHHLFAHPLLPEML